MNRIERRRLERDQRRNIDRSYKSVSLPPMVDEFSIFGVYDRIILQLESGFIDAVGNMPIVKDDNGQLCDLCYALRAWIFTWEKIVDGLGIKLDFTPLHKLQKKLDVDMPLHINDVQAAKNCLHLQRMIFRQYDRQKIKVLATAAQKQFEEESI